jgi:hypothetical protein
MTYKKQLMFSLAFITILTVNAKTIYVNNLIGNDLFDGSQATVSGTKTGPIRSIKQAFAIVKTSDKIEVANTGKAYHGGNVLSVGGTTEEPLIINGNGATISGLAVIPQAKWKKITDTVYSTTFWPKSNILRRRYKGAHRAWIGTPQIWWINGKAGINCLDRQALDSSVNGFWWDKKNRQLLVNLSPGLTISATKIQIPVYNTAIDINSSNVIVKQLTAIFSWNDGFDTHGSGKNIMFKNCIATDNCGQAFSAHGSSSVTYEDCLGMRNASSGVTNIANSQVIFKRCVIADNSFESGIFLYGKAKTTFDSCLIVHNRPFEQLWLHGEAQMIFKNSIIVAPDNKHNLLQQADGLAFFDHCTIIGGRAFASSINKRYHSKLVIKNSIVTNFSRNLVNVKDATGERLVLQNNILWNIPGITWDKKNYNQQNFNELTTLNSKISKNIFKDPQLTGFLQAQLPIANSMAKKHVGALLPAELWEKYNYHRQKLSTP